MTQWTNYRTIATRSKSKDVIMAPSNVAGMGVFALRDFKEGEVICVYSGKVLKSVENNNSCYLLKCKSWNGQRHEVLHLDSTSRQSAIARYINDVCDTYTKEGGVPDKFKTKYYTNVGYRFVCRVRVHGCGYMGALHTHSLL